MKQEELILEKKCVEYARQLGVVSVKLERNGNKGIPDRVFIFKGGYSFFTEFKKPQKDKEGKKKEVGGGRLSSEQIAWAGFLGGSNYMVCADFHLFKSKINELLSSAEKY